MPASIRRRRLNPWAVFLGLFALLAAIAYLPLYFGIGSLDTLPAARHLDAAVEAYRATGLPWHAADLDPAPVPDSKNAALPILKAMGSPTGLHFSMINDLIKLEVAGKFDTLASQLKSYDFQLSLAQESAARPALDFRRNWDLGPNLLLPEYAPMKSLGRLLCLRAIARAHQGDAKGCASDLTSAMKIADRSGKEPILIAALVEVSIAEFALRSYTICAYELRNDAAAEKLLLDSLDKSQVHPSFASFVRGEAYGGIAVLRNVEQYGGMSTITRSGQGMEYRKLAAAQLQHDGLPESVTAKANLDHYLVLWTAADRIAKAHPEDSEKAARDMEMLIMDASRKQSISNAFIRASMPTFVQTGVLIKDLVADTLVTRAMLRLAEFRARTGAMPTSLEQIGARWTDPYNGEPLNLYVNGDGARIYSVGPDRLDSGGRAKGEIHGFDAYDVAQAFPPLKLAN